mmetsp:Transcript_34610/g.80225  ORF Transcript_34610/g.80225 Transcript_34610/m.80225 type:complete len:109 (+) Transcript_34610:360-686(+)
MCMAILLYRGDRLNAKRTTLVLAALPFALGWGILTPALSAAGPWSPGLAVQGWGLAFLFTGLLTAPHHSFYLLCDGSTATFALSGIVQFADPMTTAPTEPPSPASSPS